MIPNQGGRNGPGKDTIPRNRRSHEELQRESRSSASSSRARSARSGSNSGKTRSNAGEQEQRPQEQRQHAQRRRGERSTSRSRSPRSAQAKTAQPKSLLDKAKTPLVAGGAALLGITGGAVAARNSKKRRSFPTLPTPNLKKLPSPKELMPKGDALGWIEGKAKTMGDAIHPVAELSSEAQKIKKSIEK